jgi:hypothetical protein
LANSFGPLHSRARLRVDLGYVANPILFRNLQDFTPSL